MELQRVRTLPKREIYCKLHISITEVLKLFRCIMVITDPWVLCVSLENPDMLQAVGASVISGRIRETKVCTPSIAKLTPRVNAEGGKNVL